MIFETKSDLIFDIVGAFYRKPAVVILKNLPLNTPLTLYPEPHNPKDSNAIGVWIEEKYLPLSKLKPETAATIEFNKNREVQLGFIPAVDAEKLLFDRTRAILGTFTISPTNKPQVRMRGFKKEPEQ